MRFPGKIKKLTHSHGDLLFLSYKQAADSGNHQNAVATSSTTKPPQPDPSHPHTHTDPPLPNVIPLVDLSKVEIPEVDEFWSGKDGKIERSRDPAFCRHGDKGMCDYCMPLQVSTGSLSTSPDVRIAVDWP